LGMEVQNITPELAQSMGLRHSEGVVVADVDDDGPAAEAGIRQGDVVVEVNRQRVRNADEYAAALRKSAEGTVLLLISRGDSTLYVALKP
jgi:serine protease Do